VGEGEKRQDREIASDASAARWEHFPHGADLGIRGFGPTPAAAFEQAAMALCAAQVDPRDIRLEEAIEIEAEASSLDLLLVDWLNALTYEIATRRMIFGAFKVVISGTTLKARAWGEKIARERHAPAIEAKGATFTELAVYEDRSGLWRAQCVIDV
jgi:SHS2 domain-containing protein